MIVMMRDLFASKKYEELLECCSKILGKDPLNIEALKYKAYSLYFLGQYEGAISYYNKLIELEPRNPSHYSAKSKALEKLQRHKEARGCYEQAKKIEESISNLGHSKDEWGKTQSNQQEKPRVIHSYKVKWETTD